MRRDVFRVLVFFAFCIFPFAGMAYQEQSHRDMSLAAVDASDVAVDPRTLKDLGLNPFSSGEKFKNSKGVPETIRSLFSDGAAFEDSDIRPLSHFYNPVTGLGILTFPASPDWAIDGTGDADTIKFSFKAARQYMLDALTDPVQNFRSDRFGLMFQSLGQVIHHLQDMAQPQHVRGDLHCDKLVCRFIPGAFNPSAFEGYAAGLDLPGLVASSLWPAYPVVYGSADSSTFTSARKFWNTELPGPNSPIIGKGIAEFTNRNFVSAGSNFDKPAQPSPPGFALPAFDPSPSNRTDLTVAQACAGASCPDSLVQNHSNDHIVFYGTVGRDNYLGLDVVNPRASTESIFDQDLVVQGQQRVFSINRFNFDSANQFLIPRAVGYSAGLINYFFRGKIDYVPDPANPGGFLIKNLGPEPMKGKFQVYYDDKTGARHPVDGMLWDTEVILAAAPTPGVLAPGEGMPVPRIPQPLLPEPKTIGEFMLVFSGEMGEERPENGSVGAVVGKLIQGSPYRGELYVAGLDAQNRVVTFKVDPAGLRVLNGLDQNGQLHTTPSTWISATQKDIDPLLPVVNAFPGQVLAKVPRAKQAVFESSVLGGMTYRTTSLYFTLSLNNFLAFVLDPATGRLTLRGNAIRWSAHSPDPTIGDFEFSPDVPSGTLSYVRTFRPAPNQSPITTGGSVSLAASPDEAALVFEAFKRGEAVFSPDGTTVSGIRGQSQSDPTDPFTSSWDTYDLKLTLAAQPSASLVQTEHVLEIPLNIIDPNNRTEQTSTGPTLVAPGTFTSSTHFLHIDNGERIDNDRRVFEDYISGNLVTWRVQTHGTQVIEELSDTSGISVTDPPTGCPATLTQDSQLFTQATLRQVFTAMAQLDGAITNVTKFIPKLVGGFSIGGNYTRTRTFHEVDTINCDTGGPTGPSPIVLGTPVIQDDFVFDPEAVDNPPMVSGFSLLRSLNGKVDGSILFDLEARRFVLRGQSLGETSAGFIADASPLGEIFAATSDMNTIVYDPAPSSRMPPTIEIPANIVKLIAAVWL